MSRSRRNLNVTFATLSVLFASVFLFGSTAFAQSPVEVRPLSENEQLIQMHTANMAEKSGELTSTAEELEQLEARHAELAKQLENEKKTIEELKAKIEAKKEADRKAAEAAKAPVVTASYSAPAVPANTGPVAGCGDNFYANYIYMHESGCRTHNPNGSGCDGIGQACPASKVIGPCGYDYACQNAWFTNYAIERYGSWEGAYNFWINNHWW